MRTIQASDAKVHLPELLTAVEQGESFVITRHGRAIARLVPETAMAHQSRAEAVERLQHLRRTMPAIPLAELLTLRHEGHRY
jgi:prevent-host-death family protein